MSNEPHSGRIAERLRALRDNPWFPIFGKGVAITAVMLGFSALGAVSMAFVTPRDQNRPNLPLEINARVGASR